MMGSGKSAIGKILANKLNYNFIDVDKMIEIDAGKTIKILELKETIVSLGGGAIINKNIRGSIKKNSYNIYLNVNIDILTKRLQNSKTRPLIYKKNLKKELTNLIGIREKFYRKADLIVNNEKNIIETTENIIEKIIN